MLGLGLGVMDSGSGLKTDGIPTHIKILGSYNFPEAPWIVDGGVGFGSHFFTEEGAETKSTHSIYTELAARYRLNDGWQLGAIWNTLVDSSDRLGSNTDSLTSFAGIQVMKEFNADNNRIRAGGRVMTDVGIGGETVNVVMAEVAFYFGAQPGNVAKEPARKKQRLTNYSQKAIAAHLANRAVYEFSEPGPIRFETDSTRLEGPSRAYVRRLAQALAANTHLFEAVEILGQQSEEDELDLYRDKLFMRRARAVANQFVTAGLNPSLVQVKPEGGRGVELAFHGVKNREGLKKLIQSVAR